MVGPLVTNPATAGPDRDGVGVRDAQRHVRQPHGLRHRPRRLGPAGARAQADDAGPDRAGDPRDPRAGRGAGDHRRERRRGAHPVGARRAPRGLDGRLRPEGARVVGRCADGFVLQVADPEILRWTLAHVHEAAEEAGRDPDDITVLVCAPAYVGDDSRAPRDQCRWFGGMVGNHVAEIVERYGSHSEVPAALTDYVAARKGYDYSHHGRAGQPGHAVRARRDRRPLLRPGDRRRARRQATGSCATLGMDQFAIYLMHDAPDADARGLRRRCDPRLRRGARRAPPRGRRSHLGRHALDRAAEARHDLLEGGVVRGEDRGDLHDGVAAAVAAGDEPLLGRWRGMTSPTKRASRRRSAATPPRRPRSPPPRRTRRRARRRRRGSRAGPPSARPGTASR